MTNKQEMFKQSERLRTEEIETLANSETQIAKLTESNNKLRDEVEFYKNALDEEKKNHTLLSEKISELEKTLE